MTPSSQLLNRSCPHQASGGLTPVGGETPFGGCTPQRGTEGRPPIGSPAPQDWAPGRIPVGGPVRTTGGPTGENPPRTLLVIPLPKDCAGGRTPVCCPMRRIGGLTCESPLRCWEWAPEDQARIKPMLIRNFIFGTPCKTLMMAILC